VWTWEELGDALGDDRDLATAVYGVTPAGNFGGANILFLPRPLADVADSLGIDEAALTERRTSMDDRLREVRGGRVPPHRDDKIVTAWNGFALRAFAEAGAILQDEAYLDTARGIATFLVGVAFVEGRLHRSWRKGRIGPDGFCDDYAATILGMLALYQATDEERWYATAAHLGRLMIDRFADDEGGFFATPVDGETLIARPKNTFDNPTPSDNALAAEAIAMLAAYTGDTELAGVADGIVPSVGPTLGTHPAAHGYLLAVALSTPLREVAIVGSDDRRRTFSRVVWNRFRPDVAVAGGTGESGTVPLLSGRPDGGGAVAYVCRGFVCNLPATTPADLRAQLDTV
jgi:uncharacterized protein YyaL (SSP411 family)